MYWLRSFSLLSWLVATRAMMASAVRGSSAFACGMKTAARKRIESRRSFAIPVIYGESGAGVQFNFAGLAGLRSAGQVRTSFDFAQDRPCPYVGGVSFPSGPAGFPRGGGPSSLEPGPQR